MTEDQLFWVEVQKLAQELYTKDKEPEGFPWPYIGGVAQQPYLDKAEHELRMP